MAVTAGTAEKTVTLVREAASLFRRYGFHATSMGDLGAAMNLNKGTLYHYFPSKGEILYAIYQQVFTTLEAQVALIEADLRADEKLVAYIRAITKTRAAVPDFVAVYFQEHPWLDTSLSPEHCAAVRQKEREWTAGLRAIFDDGMRDGLFRRVNTEVLAIQLISMSRRSTSGTSARTRRRPAWSPTRSSATCSRGSAGRPDRSHLLWKVGSRFSMKASRASR